MCTLVTVWADSILGDLYTPVYPIHLLASQVTWSGTESRKDTKETNFISHRPSTWGAPSLWQDTALQVPLAS